LEPIGKKIKKSDIFIIAEIGLNHDGSLGNAFRLIEEAKNAGVDAVKFQLHIADAERIKSAPTPPYYKYEDRHEYYERTFFSIKEWKKLKKISHSLGLYFIVSPFSNKAIDILEDVGVDAYKIASGETTNLPLLEYINSKNKPVLLSTGMSNWNEITNAVEVLEKNLIVIFQCTSIYPCNDEKVGLNIIKEIKDKFQNYIIGFSDHTLGYSAAIGAFLYGAKVFEKHFTLSKNMYGPDAQYSFTPEEMKKYIQELNSISRILKNPINKDDLEIFKEVKIKYEKSIVASRDLDVNHKLTFNDLDFKKPGNGIRADKYKQLIGKIINRKIKKNEQIKWIDLKQE